ncbi:hypothetical protein HOP50_05g37650 [Chloropicon primus]|uniref:Uncharacterized protein n=1 Tax=Chloropicon primus TaxID=1764295 RepID=A0A5B8ML84_9CHLO|nr:hypothetical protein A3770_05p37550 [Chloropicon primus]UPR00451.1 hypothetical protein HOP50_05g37650 [Chloropicon primus]|eukprot:QDZ21237.1 hypothetical protein A3770_05p37550 [Chloropicon primus]
MIAATRADHGGDDDKGGGLPPGVTAMDMDGEPLASFLTGSTTIIEEESDSEEDTSGGAGSSFQPGSSQVQLCLFTELPLCSHCTGNIYAIAKEYLNRSTTDNLNEEDSNTTATATANNSNSNTTSSPSPSPYALDLREALESGLMTEEEYAEAVQEAQRYDSKSPEKKREIADYNEALRIISADASLKLSDRQQCIVKREYLEEVGLCKPRRSSKRRPSKTAPSIVKVKEEE